MPKHKEPGFYFYPCDWMGDPNLRRCKPEAKGTWMDMICLMDQNDPKGVLSHNGTPWTTDDIARAIGGDPAIIAVCVQELLDKGVASRDENGAIYCRRIVRSQEISRVRSQAGLAGVEAKRASIEGSKQVSKQEANREAKGQQNTGRDRIVFASSSEGEGVVGEGGGQPVPHPGPTQQAIADYVAYPDFVCLEILELYPKTRRGPRASARVAISAALAYVIGPRHKTTKEAVAWLKARTAAYGASWAGQRGQYTLTAENWYSKGGYDQTDDEWADQTKPPTSMPTDHAKVREARIAKAVTELGLIAGCALDARFKRERAATYLIAHLNQTDMADPRVVKALAGVIDTMEGE